MTKYQKIKMLFICFLSLFSAIKPDNSKYLYQQLSSELLKKVSIEDPSEQEQELITACYLLEQFGTEHPTLSEELWQTLTNTQIITEVLPTLQKPHTTLGHIALAEQSTRFSNNLAILQNKVSLLNYLESHPDIAQKINTLLKQVTPIEKKFLDFVKNKKEFSDFYYQKLGLDKFNESKWLHELWARFNVASFALPLIMQPLGEKLYLDFCKNPEDSIDRLVHNIKHCSFTEKIANFAALSKDALTDYYTFISSIPKHIKDNTLYNNIHTYSPIILSKKFDFQPSETQNTVISTGLTSLVYAYGAWCAYTKLASVYQGFMSNKATFDGVYEQQSTLIQTSFLIRTIKDLCNLIENNQALQDLIPEYKQMKNLFDSNNMQLSDDAKSLVRELLTASFDGDPSYYFSQQGKIIATYHLLCRTYGELTPYLQALGHIDAYIATHQLYSSQKNHLNAKICLANFIDQETPHINIKKFWHPLIDPWKVITNDLEMGNLSTNANLIITGPNAGGKTTALTALITNIILAQSFGITTATQCTLTPFTKVHSYLDITTNLLQGESLFKAEVNRSKKLKESILKCNNGEKTFTIIDEIFSGTNQEVASDLALQFAKQLGNFSHSMTLITTHIPEMTTLAESTERYENYKVADATIYDGIITYPFKLIPGISEQNIAQQMLEIEGII